MEVLVPYSMWSEMAMDIVPDSIRADHIQDGAIELLGDWTAITCKRMLYCKCR